MSNDAVPRGYSAVQSHLNRKAAGSDRHPPSDTAAIFLHDTIFPPPSASCPQTEARPGLPLLTARETTSSFLGRAGAPVGQGPLRVLLQPPEGQAQAGAAIRLPPPSSSSSSSLSVPPFTMPCVPVHQENAAFPLFHCGKALEQRN